MGEGVRRLTLATSRLLLRPLSLEDEPVLAGVLSDAETMRWYPHPFSREEVRDWIERQMGRYSSSTGLLGMVEKESGSLIGDCGVVWQDVEGQMELEVGYHVHRECWNRGFATEAAGAMTDFAFGHLGVDHVISMIRPENVASWRVAEKNGFAMDRLVLWHDYNHCVYRRGKK